VLAVIALDRLVRPCTRLQVAYADAALLRVELADASAPSAERTYRRSQTPTSQAGTLPSRRSGMSRHNRRAPPNLIDKRGQACVLQDTIRNKLGSACSRHRSVRPDHGSDHGITGACRSGTGVVCLGKSLSSWCVCDCHRSSWCHRQTSLAAAGRRDHNCLRSASSQEAEPRCWNVGARKFQHRRGLTRRPARAAVVQVHHPRVPLREAGAPPPLPLKLNRQPAASPLQLAAFAHLLFHVDRPRVPLRAAGAPQPLPLSRQPEACLLQLAAFAHLVVHALPAHRPRVPLRAAGAPPPLPLSRQHEA
jgi:hypothetical protein